MPSHADGRVVSVAPERLPGWLGGFATRHGHPEATLVEGRLFLAGPDGATASIRLDWGPLPGVDPVAEVVAAAARPRLAAALIVRRRAHAVGVFSGEQLLAGRHDHHYVQSRTKAGGWSQQRYARRRGNQAERAYQEAAEDAVAVLVPRLTELEFVATGGDQAAVTQVLAEPALAGLARLPRVRVDGVPEPNASVLSAFGKRLREVRITLNELA
jgi:hypothetical protein